MFAEDSPLSSVIGASAPALWRTEKIVVRSGHSLHSQDPSPVSKGFVAPTMLTDIRFRPEALAASMARTLALRHAPDELLLRLGRAQLPLIEYLIADGASFALTPELTALADDERSGFAGRVGAGITDLLMNAMGYVWRDNAVCLSGSLDPHADFIYGGGAVSGHGVVLAEAHGSFAQAVSTGRISGEARRKYLRQVKPYIAGSCVHGQVIHGYAVAFGSHPTGLDTYLHVAETRIKKEKAPVPPATLPPAVAAAPAPLALAAHRSNFLLMGSSRVVAWIDWLRGAGPRPDEEAEALFLSQEIGGRRFWVAAETLLPYVSPWLFPDDLAWPWDRWRWEDFTHRRLTRGPDNVFAMDERAAKSFLHALSGMIGSGPEQFAPTIELPIIAPSGLFEGEGRREEDERYPVAQFRDGLALLSRLPRSPRPDTRVWSPHQGLI